MNEGLEKLKIIGVQKIYEKTHITRRNVENILNRSFDKIPKVQFRGFISILEREYKVDLQDLVKEFESYTKYEEKISETLIPELKNEYIKFNNKTLVIALMATFVIGYFIISSLVHSKTESTEINNSEIATAKANLDHNDSNITAVVVDSNETNKSLEHNSTKLPVTPTQTTSSTPIASVSTTQDAAKGTKFEIIPEKVLWVLYREMGSDKHHQAITQSPITLDPSKNYLLELGHGLIKVNLGTEIKEFHGQNKKYFKYENGQLTELSGEDFKSMNKE
jgi:hypothetical protein